MAGIDLLCQMLSYHGGGDMIQYRTQVHTALVEQLPSEVEMEWNG